MHVLAVGGGGKVGTLLRPALESEHTLHIFDRHPIHGWNGHCLIGDVNDEAAIKAAVHGMDAIIYLAMGMAPAPEGTGDIDQAFGVNMKGLYRTMAAGLKTGVRRFVYASSLSVFHEPWALPIDETMKPTNWGAYAVSKRLGEAVCEAAAIQEPGATVVVLRLVKPDTKEQITKRGMEYYIAPNDLGRLFLAALALSSPGLHVLHASSRDTPDLPNTMATQVLGWRPEGT